MKKEVVVVKIGSSVLLTQRQKLDEFRIAELAHQLAALKKTNINAALVVSGAVACGLKSVAMAGDYYFAKTLAAGIGQAMLTSTFERIFSQCGLLIAQILITKRDLAQREETQRLAATIKAYVEMDVVPLINENDVIALNDFGGNDFLAVDIAQLLQATRLVVLSTMKGSEFGVGGGIAKQAALQKAEQLGIKSLIVNGKLKNILLKTI